ncbi:fatty acid desaturase family protein [Rhodopirellula maiorica SM1]|uniref:Fatty acid desaturase family protein n=1 Tax=Rhodopirellula maiorica SM1 TaxID=1265738 RepID=M5R9Q2_9BACT|nr:fatty acid desaturase [Rhodopirellula maiorica]EMI16223.1 fatty acid desaturase family protein [Rhodopirellula maiorica SM1]
MSTNATSSAEFSFTESRRVIGDLFRPHAWVYWADFLLTYAAGAYSFAQVSGGPIYARHQGFQGTFHQTFFFFVSVLLFYRASLFIHEVVHQRNNERLKWFRIVWNLVCGIPFLIPSFVYYTHIDHHRRKHYGTDHDGEYLPLEHQQGWQILFYLSWSLIIPIVAVVRFLVLTPLAWVIPGFRAFVHQHASSMVMDPTYIRPLPTKKTLKIIYIQEFGCFLWSLAIVVIAPLAVGQWPTPFLIHAYLLSVCIIFLNSIRTIGSHRWSNAGDEMTFLDQLLDSVNYPHHAWITELWGPVGTRFHALHHLFPSLPYHALPEAHRRLMKSLPANSPYRQTEERSLTAAIINLVKRNRQTTMRAASQQAQA